MGSHSYKYCLCFTRRFRWSDAQPPVDVKEAFAAYADADGGARMTPNGLRRFLTERQDYTGSGKPEDAAERIVEQVRQIRHGHIAKLGRSSLTLEDFHFYLFSDELNPSMRDVVHQEMNFPLSHYFTYTGHNSYLTGNQLSSDCSDLPIIAALKRGVRVIELDMWPNVTKDDIDILHGRTLTSPVPLIKCLRSIRENAFIASPYPVIITLEDHLTPDLQAKVAKMVVETFGSMLYYPRSEFSRDFPSPEFLKNKIIISTKPPKEYLESRDNEDKLQKAKWSKEEDEAWDKEVLDIQVAPEPADKTDDEVDDYGDDDDKKNNQNIPTEYKRLITIRAGKPKGHIRDALKVEPDKVRRLSLSEQQLVKTAQSHGVDIVRFTQKNILRVYPKGTRFNSSNYNPFVGWIHGAQMVAFNMQGYGKSLWLMHGFFRANGGCGYVKKPDFLMTAGPNNEVFDPNVSLPVKTILKVRIYMGDGWIQDFKRTHFDAYSPPDFYTKIGIAGVPADEMMDKTKILEDDWAPVWDQAFTFPLTVPELALLRIEVHEYDMSEKDDFGGQTCLPVSELRPGIRSVPLYNRKGIKYKSVRLLMRFDFESEQ